MSFVFDSCSLTSLSSKTPVHVRLDKAPRLRTGLVQFSPRQWPQHVFSQPQRKPLRPLRHQVMRIKEVLIGTPAPRIDHRDAKLIAQSVIERLNLRLDAVAVPRAEAAVFRGDQERGRDAAFAAEFQQTAGGF